MKIKTADLIDLALDWAVTHCTLVEVEYINDGITRCLLGVSPFTGMYRPTVDWSQGWSIIEREGLDIMCLAGGDDGWQADKYLHTEKVTGFGPTPLIAAMRCLVASRLGDEVDIPEELLS